MIIKVLKTGFILFLSLFFFVGHLSAKKDSLRVKYNPYKLNYFVDLPITAAGLLASKYGTDYLRARNPKHPEKIAGLSSGDIWWFDRPATKQDPLQAGKWLSRSDILMRGAMWVPVVMFFDSGVRDLHLAH